jgi:dolichol-phosphate mannosyltransferase
MKDNKKILIAIATYKEAENLENLIKEIRKFSQNLKILIINDYSDDKTQELLKSLNDKNLELIERPKKLGLGTAHKLSIFYSIKFEYDYLVTMDADFSHDPSYIPKLLEKKGPNNFIIGSRFCEGAKSDYKGLRKAISVCGNYFAKKLLNIELNEITTYFRVYSVNLLKTLPFNELNAQGYSLGVKLVWLMKKIDAQLIEVPIYFKDRNKGKSKIPKLQIFVSFFDLLFIFLKNILIKQKFYTKKNNTYNFNIFCDNCQSTFFSIKKNKSTCLVCNYEKN